MALNDTSGAPFVVEYEPTETCKFYEDYIPRFGHSDNLTAVFEDANLSESSDYLIGLIFVGCIIGGIFLVWSTFLLVSMCMGRKAGFVSGAAFSRKLPPKTDDSIHEYAEPSAHFGDDDIPLPQTPEERMSGLHATHRSVILTPEPNVAEAVQYRIGDPWRSRPTRSRIVFMVSGMICIAFGILMVTEGITNLQTSINIIGTTTSDLNDLTQDAQIVIQKGLLERYTLATNLRLVIQKQLNSTVFCPKDPTMSGSPLARAMRDSKNKVLDSLAQLNDFRKAELEDFDNAMEVLQDLTSDVSNNVDSIDVNDWQSLIVILPYTIFPSLMVIAALFAFHDVPVGRFSCLINWFVLPIFILMTVVAVGVSAGMTIAAGINSDFCLPGGRSDSSPDELILSVMAVQGHDETSYPYEVAKFYIMQCAKDDPFYEIRKYTPQLVASVNATSALISDFQNQMTVGELAVYCNRDYEEIAPLLLTMRNVVAAFAESVGDTLDLAKCGRMIPLYTNTVYDAGCLYAPSAVFWVFGCSLVLGTFGMIMITLRSSMKVTEVEQDYKNHFLESIKANTNQQYQYNDDQYNNEVDDQIVEVPPSPQFLDDEDEHRPDDYVVDPSTDNDERHHDDEVPTIHNDDNVVDMPNEPSDESPTKPSYESPTEPNNGKSPNPQ